MTPLAPPLPVAFIWKRLHSLTGFFLVLFLTEHLLVNSQAALLVGEDGMGFVHAVNSIRDLPFLPFLELTFLGIPFLIHIVWGIEYLRTGRFNSFYTDGSTPMLPEYARNRAYTWQRITAWIIFVGLIAHVVQMRVLQYPDSVKLGDHTYYTIPLERDPGLLSLSTRLGVQLWDPVAMEQLQQAIQNFVQTDDRGTLPSFFPFLFDSPTHIPTTPLQLLNQQKQQVQHWTEIMQKHPLHPQEVLAVANSFGLAELLMVRETFKSPTMIALYTLFVLASCYHAFNGVWTFMIKWGISLTERARYLILQASIFLMMLVSFLGLAAIWGSYWINLKH